MTKKDVEFLTMLEIAESIINRAAATLAVDDFFAQDICDGLFEAVKVAKEQQNALMGI
ncbi:hypothetical protein [Lactococcus petauri]|uniref:hypothetical protein n=1 Tax=Lactococcus petauri TaxID=1940789 RepID=UPI0030D17E66